MPFIPRSDGPCHEALQRARAHLEAAEARGTPHAMSQALAQVARCYQALHAVATAEAYFDMALRWSRLTGSVDQAVELLCELCEATARLALAQQADRPGSGDAARERARDHAFEAAQLAARVADPEWEIKVLLRISDVLDRCGDRSDAVALQARALRLMAGGPAGAAAQDLATMPGLTGVRDC